MIAMLIWVSAVEGAMIAKFRNNGQTRDNARAWRMGAGLESGMVGLNTGAISTELAPFGGIKQSGMGREGSKYGCDDYLEIRSLTFGGLG